MTFQRGDPRRERGRAVPFEPGLSAEELARAARFKQAYRLCATGGVGCIWEAARIVDRLSFVKWVHRDELEAR